MVRAMVAAYGHKLFAVTLDNIKKLDATHLIDHLNKICTGLFQEATSVEEAVFILVKSLLREHLPQNGKVFLETTNSTNMTELRQVMDAWLSTRAPGDMTKVPGASSHNGSHSGSNSHNNSKQDRGHKDTHGKTDKHEGDRPTCTVCGKYDHKTETCWYKSGSGSNNFSSAPRPVTCFICKQDGHKSHDCPQKGKGPGEEHQEGVQQLQCQEGWCGVAK